MSKEDFQLTTLTRELDDGNRLVEAWGCAEISALGDAERVTNTTFQSKAMALLEEATLTPALSAFRRRFGIPVELDEIELTIDAPARRPEWREPVVLRLPVVRWVEHGLHQAWLPALEVHVFATRADLLADRLREHARLILAGSHKRILLQDLAVAARERSLTTGKLAVSVSRKTPRQLAEAANQPTKEKSVLSQIAEELPPLVTTESKAPARLVPVAAFEVENELTQLAEALSGAAARSVLLVGPPGSGKTALVRELARRRRDFGFPQTPFWSTSGARLMTGPIGFGMWQERCQGLCREAAKTRAIVHLGNLWELIEVGKANRGEQSVGGYLRPWLARGDLLAIVECTAEQLGGIERLEPHLPGVFRQLEIVVRTPEQTRAILDRVYDRAERQHHDQGSARSRRVARGEKLSSSTLPAAQPALERLLQLHQRYATYSASPGRPVRFLERLLVDHPPAQPLTEAAVIEAFSRETGLPALLLDDRVRLDLSATRGWFTGRVAGQTEAVERVLDLLALTKARLARPRKPLASLLFIGPTGTGKTELAKALATFLFGDASRLTRFDLNEFNDPVSIQRLIGGFAAKESEGLLTARVREQPFSVVLLDEFEKADPAFFDLLLQILGEGRLTDAAGRVADFCNCVIVMTSNLGADGFQRGSTGFHSGSPTEGAAAHFSEAVRRFLRPEIYNRIDAILPFAPLSLATVNAIAGNEVNRVLQRDGVRLRPVAVELDPAVFDHLATRGHDARLGARPLKRVVESELAVPLAEALGQYVVTTPLDVRIGVRNEVVSIDVRARLGREADADRVRQQSDSTLVGAILKRRRRIARLLRCHAVQQLESRITMFTALERRLARAGKKSATADPRLAELPALRASLERVAALMDRARALEDEALAALHRGGDFARPVYSARLEQLAGDCLRIQRDVYRRHLHSPDDVVLAFYCEHPETLLRVAAAYRALATRLGKVLAVEFLSQPASGRSRDVRWLRETVAKPAEFFAKPPPRVIGIVLQLRGELFQPRFEGEAGLHEFKGKDARHECLIDVSATALAAYQPPAGIELKGGIASQGAELQRSFDRESNHVIDQVLGRRPWLTLDLERCLEGLTGDRLNELIESGTG